MYISAFEALEARRDNLLMPTDMEDGVPQLEFAGLLASLSLTRHSARLAEESIVAPADLALLSKDDCKELGLSLGERNRVAHWAEAQRRQREGAAGPAAPSSVDGSGGAAALALRVEALAEEVAEREGWVAASLDAAEMKRRAEEAQRRRSRRGAPVNVRTRVAPAQVKAKAKQEARKRKKRKMKAQPKAAVAVMANALFANAGTARRIGFAIDISGSMAAGAFGGLNRLDVVKKHLRGAIGSMEGAFNAAFSVVLFDTECHMPMGDSLTPANWTGVKKADACIEAMQPGGGNGGEAACMLALLKMRPQAIFFLGDGGWGEGPLIDAANLAKSQGVTVHSIAFFTSGGGLPEIAQITAGTYREVNGADDLEEMPEAKSQKSKPAAGGVLPGEDEDEEDSDSGGETDSDDGEEDSDSDSAEGD
jgi:hypothetical protein